MLKSLPCLTIFVCFIGALFLGLLEYRFYSHLGTGASEVSLVMVVFPKEEGLLMASEQRPEELRLRSLVLLWHCQLCYNYDDVCTFVSTIT